MIKRPLLAAALSLTVISIIIVYKFPALVYPEASYSDGENTTLICQINEIEEKTNSFYLYAYSGGLTLLLCAPKSSLDISDIKIGNTVKAYAEYTEWSSARNYGNFDEEEYYKSLGVCRKFYLNEFEIVNESYSPLKELLRSFKNILKNKIEIIADSETAGIFTAIVCGEKSDLDSSTKSLFQLSGIAHVLAVSGLHISFLGLGLFRILRKKIRFIPAAIAAMCFAGTYALMCGFTASSFRSVIMLAVRFLAVKAGKKYDMLSSMSLAAILLLLKNPFYITNSGFLLSFSALFAAAAVIPILTDLFNSKKIPSALISSISISITTLPVIISLYYEFPLYGFVINIPVLWLLSYILAGVFAGVLCSLFWEALGRFLIGFSVYLTDSVKFICTISLNLPCSRIITGFKSVYILIIYYFLLTALLMIAEIINRRSKRISAEISVKNIIKRAILTIVIISLMISLLVYRPNDTSLRISFIDVDQGKCILLITPTGQTVMIDGGSTTVTDVYTYRIKSTLKYKGISMIDYIFVTHPDTDHISAVIDMTEAGDFNIGEILIADFGDNENYLNLLESSEDNNIKVEHISSSYTLNISDVSFKCLNSADTNTDIEGTDVNDMSSVFSVTYGSFTALFTGDISAEEEKILINNSDLPEKVNLLDVAHHGSKYSSCEEFLSKINPDVSVISAGIDNIYGHPHAETLERLEDCGSEIYTTINCGEIDITAQNSGNMEINTYLNILK